METNPPPKNNSKNRLRTNYARYAGMAFQMLAIILLGAWAGKKADEKLGNEKPIITLILSLSAIILSMYLVIKDVMRNNKSSE